VWGYTNSSSFIDAEKRIGFWLAYLVPLVIYLMMPLFLAITYKSLIKLPPQGSVVFDTIKVGKLLISRGGLRAAFKGGDDFWNSAKPVSCTYQIAILG
jgi:POT family proton-dependent oligopeptide transporter